MSASNSQGINTLLEAEREASKIVQKAKQYRLDRLKAARTEAAKEIELLKEQKTREFQQSIDQHSGESTQGETHINQNTDATIAQIKTEAGAKMDEAVAALLKAVTTVNAAPHENTSVPS